MSFGLTRCFFCCFLVICSCHSLIACCAFRPSSQCLPTSCWRFSSSARALRLMRRLGVGCPVLVRKTSCPAFRWPTCRLRAMQPMTRSCKVGLFPLRRMARCSATGSVSSPQPSAVITASTPSSHQDQRTGARDASSAPRTAESRSPRCWAMISSSKSSLLAQ